MRYIVPDGMIRAATDYRDEAQLMENGSPIHINSFYIQCLLEAALQWLAKNPIEPTNAQAKDMRRMLSALPVTDIVRYPGDHDREDVQWYCCEWQRRMFLAVEGR